MARTTAVEQLSRLGHFTHHDRLLFQPIHNPAEARGCSRRPLKANGIFVIVDEPREPSAARVRDLSQLVGGRMPTPGVEPRFYTLEDVATILNVRIAQVYALVRSGDLPAIKLGGRGVWRVDRLQLEEYIERMHEQTRQWAIAHPLTGAPEED
jgi:excisionase family DNA binding protein